MKAVKATVFHPAGLNGQEILVRGTDVTELGKKQANKHTNNKHTNVRCLKRGGTERRVLHRSEQGPEGKWHLKSPNYHADQSVTLFLPFLVEIHSAEFTVLERGAKGRPCTVRNLDLI